MSKLVYIEKPWEDSDYEYGLVPATDNELRKMGYVRVTVECEACEGRGEVHVSALGVSEIWDCGVCFGRGWVPAPEVVYRHGRHEYDTEDDRYFFIVPAEAAE